MVVFKWGDRDDSAGVLMHVSPSNATPPPRCVRQPVQWVSRFTALRAFVELDEGAYALRERAPGMLLSCAIQKLAMTIGWKAAYRRSVERIHFEVVFLQSTAHHLDEKWCVCHTIRDNVGGALRAST